MHARGTKRLQHYIHICITGDLYGTLNASGIPFHGLTNGSRTRVDETGRPRARIIL